MEFTLPPTPRVATRKTAIVLEARFIDLFVRNSGLRDRRVAERDVVLTYALAALSERATLDHLAFKGGTCLRKVVFGSNGRFSDDLDFTIRTDLPEEDVLAEVVDAFRRRVLWNRVQVRRILQDGRRHFLRSRGSLPARMERRGRVPAAGQLARKADTADLARENEAPSVLRASRIPAVSDSLA